MKSIKYILILIVTLAFVRPARAGLRHHPSFDISPESLLQFLTAEQRRLFRSDPALNFLIPHIATAIRNHGSILPLLQNSTLGTQYLMRAAYQAAAKGVITTLDYISANLLQQAWHDYHRFNPQVVVQDVAVFLDTTFQFSTPEKAENFAAYIQELPQHERRVTLLILNKSDLRSSPYWEAIQTQLEVNQANLSGAMNIWMQDTGSKIIIGIPHAAIFLGQVFIENAGPSPWPTFAFGEVTSQQLMMQVKNGSRVITLHFPGVKSLLFAHDMFLGEHIMALHDMYHFHLLQKIPTAAIELISLVESRLSAYQAADFDPHRSLFRNLPILREYIADLEAIFVSLFSNPHPDRIRISPIPTPPAVARTHARTLLNLFYAPWPFDRARIRSRSLIEFVSQDMLETPTAYQSIFPGASAREIVASLAYFFSEFSPLTQVPFGELNTNLRPLHSQIERGQSILCAKDLTNDASATSKPNTPQAASAD